MSMNKVCVMTPSPNSTLPAEISARNKQIIIDNAYFRTTAHVVQMHGEDRISDDFAAVVVAVAVNEVEAGRRWWERVAGDVGEDAVRLFLVTGPSFGESEAYDLVAWGVGLGIEVVCAFVCEEDGIEPRRRIREAFDCAPWPQRENKHSDGLREDDVKDKRIQKETRIRRGLDRADVERLTAYLLLVDSSDSEEERNGGGVKVGD